MPGLTEDDLLEFMPAKPVARLPDGSRDDDALRADFIRKDIYARHSIPPDVPLDQAIEMIEMHAGETGNGPSAWANPEERAKAREEYARKGKDPLDVERRWRESAYLLDPQTAQYQQHFARDADFLEGLQGSNKARALRDQNYESDQQGVRAAAAAGGTGMPPPSPYHDPLKETLKFWDSSNNSQLHRKGTFQGTYANTGGVQGGTVNAMTNPDEPVGNYLTFSEVVPDTLRMGMSESKNAGEAYRAAQSRRLAGNRYRAYSPAPILDLPEGASAEDRAKRLRELRQLVDKAALPNAEQRWAKWSKETFGSPVVPPGIVSDGLDFVYSQFDPSALLIGAGAARNAAKHGMKAAAADLARNTIADQKFEQMAGHGIAGAMGGQPGRTWGQYIMPHTAEAQSRQESAEARNAREMLHRTLKDDAGVSTADNSAYDRLYSSGLVPPNAYFGGF